MAGVAQLDDVRVEEGQGALTIWLDAPRRRNALNASMMGRLADAVERSAEGNHRLILIRGAGGCFCAGRARPVESDGADEAEARLAEALRLARAMYRCSKPLVAIVEGYAIGIGLSLALWCDFAIAEADAQFGAPEVRLGFPPTMTAVTLLRRVARPYALDFLLTGRRFGAAEAMAAGMLRGVVEADSLDAWIASLVADFEQTVPAAAAACKALLRDVEPMGFEDALALAARTTLDVETSGAKI